MPSSGKETSAVDRLVYAGILLLIVWAPLPFGSNKPFLISLIICWSIALGLIWLIGWSLGRVQPVPRSPGGKVVLVLFVAWVAVLAVQVMPLSADMAKQLSPGSASAYLDSALGTPPARFSTSIERDETLQYLLLSFAYLILFALMLAVTTTGKRLQGLCYALVISGTLQAILGLALLFSNAHYVLFFREMSHGDHLRGGFIYHNSLAAFLEICLGCGIGLMVSQFEQTNIRTAKQRVRWLLNLILSPKLALRILLIVMVIGLILTRSRMGNGAFFACTLVVGLIGLILMRQSGRAITVFFVSMIAVDVLLVGSWVGLDKVTKRMEETAMSNQVKQSERKTEESVEERGVPSAAAIRAWHQFPLLGSGADTFSYLYPAYRPGQPTGFYEHAHNDYAEFLLEYGGVGFGIGALIYVSTAIAALWAVWRRRDPIKKGLALGCFFALLCIALHMIVDMPLQIPANGIAFVTVLALTWLCVASGRPRRSASESRSVDS